MCFCQQLGDDELLQTASITLVHSDVLHSKGSIRWGTNAIRMHHVSGSCHEGCRSCTQARNCYACMDRPFATALSTIGVLKLIGAVQRRGRPKFPSVMAFLTFL